MPISIFLIIPAHSINFKIMLLFSVFNIISQMNSENYSCYNLDYMCNQYISNQMDCEKSDCFFN